MSGAEDEAALDAWLAAFAASGWEGARIDAVAQGAGIDVAALAAHYPDRWSAVAGLRRRVELAALSEAASDPEASVRERLFSLIMAGFDAAQPHRDAVAVLYRAARREPALTALALANVALSLGRVAAAAGVEGGGWRGPLRLQALAWAHRAAFRAWLEDESADLAATMRTLDGALGRIERLAGLGGARALPD